MLGTIPSIPALLKAVETGESSAIVSALQIERDALVKSGIDQKLLAAIQQSLSSGEWDEPVFLFGQETLKQAAFYLGPMRAYENSKPEMSLILLTLNETAQKWVPYVEEKLPVIGDKLFGAPCGFAGRQIEIYNVAIAAASCTRAQPIALFTPFYLGGWKDNARQLPHRRTVLYHNAVQDRFENLTTPIAVTRIRFDGASPLCCTTETEKRSAAISLWLVLHEMMHANGPLPLFGAPVSKLALRQTYASLEEARVDMTIWMLLHQFHDLFGDTGSITADFIMAERLARSAKIFGEAEKIKTSKAETEHGRLWHNLLLHHGALEKDARGFLNVSRETAGKAIQEFLSGLYETESQAGENPPEGALILTGFANTVREKYMKASHV